MISIIIVNYNLKRDLFECIESIIKSKPSTPYEIIVIDNSDKNEIEKDINSLFSKVVYIKTNKNLGYGAGNNLGVKYAKGDYVFILNPDTKIIEGDINNLVNIINRNKKAGAVAPLLVHKDNNPFELQGVKELTPKRAMFALSFIEKLIPRNKIYKDYYYYDWDKSKLKEVDVVPGTAFLIKKEIYNKIGGFDPNFFLYFEEFDLCRRLRKLGFKNYITPSLKIYHKWGASTEKNKQTSKHFLQSRFYYFRKNFGLLNALLVESFLRINKEIIFLFLISILALFLRLYDLPQKMAFIGDTAWFYVSAKNFLETGSVPLVGITSSHIWLHQGPFWTYILAIILPLSNFNPIAPAYFTAFLDLLTLIAIYLFCKMYLNTKIAIISAFFYAISPMIVIFSRIPYHTNPIPLLTLLLITSILKWTKGDKKYFAFSFFFLALLYNFEISIIPLGFSIVFVILYGFIKKTRWLKSILNKKSISLAIIGGFVPMIPMLLYDLNHGFSQTIKVFIWIIYRLAVTFGYPPLHPDVPGEAWHNFFRFIIESSGRFYFMKNNNIAFSLLLTSILFAVFSVFKYKQNRTVLSILLTFFLIPTFSFIFAKTSSQAYLPMLFVQLVILLAYFFGSLRGKLFYISLILIILIGISNIKSIFDFYNSSLNMRFDKRVSTAEKIVKAAGNSPYNIVITSFNSKFESSTSPYEYLSWRLGHGPSKKDEKLKIYVYEKSDDIIVERGN